MNYLFVVFIILIVLLIIDRYLPKKINEVTSNYNGETTDSIGFVKPEHRLLKILNEISSGSKIKLSGDCTQFVDTKNTISVELNDKLMILLKELVSSINTISENDFFIKKIENVYSSVDRKSNQRYVVDFFIYDIKHYYTIRLIADIVIIDKDIYINYLNIQSGSSNSLLNQYDIKLNSIGILFDSDMFHKDLVSIFDNYYTNSFNVIGVSDTNLEYNKEDLSEVFTFNSFKNAYLPASISSKTYEELDKKDLTSYLEMYLPEKQPMINSKEFCNKYKIEWDTLGIPIETDVEEESCYANNNQTTNKINEPWFGPGVIYQRSSEDKYEWLKDPGTRNIIRSHGFNL